MEKRKVFPDSISPLQGQPGKPADPSLQLPLLFSLSIPAGAQKELEEKVAAGKVITPAELKTKYGPDPTEVNRLVDWLKGQGFVITGISPNGTGVYASAGVAAIGKSLQVEMTTVTKEGVSWPAATSAPSLPADIGRPVHAIIGLQPYRQAHKHRQLPSPLPAGAQPFVPPYRIADILKAYNADNLNLTGKGQTIGILIDTAPLDTDLAAFWQKNNLTVDPKQITVINVKGQPLPPPDGEETMDTQWASGIAPGADIRIYAAGSLHFVDLDKGLDAILADAVNFPGMRQVSISIGLGETYIGGPDGQVAAEHQKFLRLAALGVNVFASSGDAGSNPDLSAHNPGGALQAEYAASDPSVIGVGGTSLRLAADGSISEETGWSSGGGGKSILFPRPDWQKGNGVPAGTERLIPDVSLAADPNLGANIILNGKDQQVGGTSWSAPAWAAFCALINEARSNAGKPALPFLNPLIYPLLGTPAFRDITSGSNGAYTASPGYDLVTGIGVPNVAALITALNNS